MAKLGDRLYDISLDTLLKFRTNCERVILIAQGLISLKDKFKKIDKEELDFDFLIGMLPDETPIISSHKHKKEKAISIIENIKNFELFRVELCNIADLMERFLMDILREILLEYPDEIEFDPNETINPKNIFGYESIEEFKKYHIEKQVKNYSYLGPDRFRRKIKKLLGLNLDIRADFDDYFDSYVEIKASRDIFVHNNNKIDDIYLQKLKKANLSDLARGNPPDTLPVDYRYYYMSSYACVYLIFKLKKELLSKWPKSPNRQFTAREESFKLTAESMIRALEISIKKFDSETNEE